MTIHDGYDFGGKHYDLEYEDCDDFSTLPDELCKQIYGVCFYEGKIMVGLHVKGDKEHWKIIGGTREVGETVEETLVREVLEESNMDVLEQKPLGYQKVIGPDGDVQYQLRSWCRVQPRGPFVADPAGNVQEIKLIDPRDYKQYFDWKEVGDRIIQRALELEERKEKGL